jgi:hypothetical protein
VLIKIHFLVRSSDPESSRGQLPSPLFRLPLRVASVILHDMFPLQIDGVMTCPECHSDFLETVRLFERLRSTALTTSLIPLRLLLVSQVEASDPDPPAHEEEDWFSDGEQDDPLYGLPSRLPLHLVL